MVFDPRKGREHHDVLHGTNGYLHGCGEGGGDCDGDYTDWHDGMDDVTRLLAKVESVERT